MWWRLWQGAELGGLQPLVGEGQVALLLALLVQALPGLVHWKQQKVRAQRPVQAVVPEPVQ